MIHILAKGYALCKYHVAKVYTEFDYYEFIGYENMRAEREDYISKNQSKPGGISD